MSRKIYSIISLVLVFLSQILVISSILNSNNTSVTIESQPETSLPSQPETSLPDLPEEPPELVIPESPIGTLSLISALAAAFGMFALIRKRK